MDTQRLEAFSDGVIAILITIMVLELKVPLGSDVQALREMLPTILTYVLSFINLGIYWNNHHHLLHVAERVNGAVMWANLHLLFWLSLVPFAMGWLAEHHTAAAPTALYGAVLLAAAIAYTILTRTLLAAQGPNSKLAAAIGEDVKGKISAGLYVVAIPSAFVNQYIADAVYVAVAMMWFVPDRRIERRIMSEP